MEREQLVELYTKWKNHFDEYNRTDNSAVSFELFEKWVKWVSSLPRFEEIPLLSFTSCLEEKHRKEFEVAMKTPVDPIHMVAIDLDACICKDAPNIIRHMEQPSIEPPSLLEKIKQFLLGD